MNKISLSQKQFDLFLKIIKNNNNIVYKVDKINIIIDNANRERIIDLISDYYTQRGIGKDYESNKLGAEIEDLLDKFN